MTKLTKSETAIETIDDEEMLPDEGNMTLLEHLTELRQRLLWVVLAWVAMIVVGLAFADNILNFLIAPYKGVLAENSEFRDVNVRMIATTLPEILFTQLKASAFVATILISPFLLAQVWGFISPGLYKQERKAFWPFLVATPFLFLMGASLVYFVLMPLMSEFFLGMQQLGVEDELNIEIEPRISEYFSLVMRLMLAFGFCFQLPVAATLMGRSGLITSGAMKRARKYALVVVLLVGAILTPPDGITQLMLAVPLAILYELSIYLVKMSEKARGYDENEFDDDEYDDDEEFYDEEDSMS